MNATAFFQVRTRSFSRFAAGIVVAIAGVCLCPASALAANKTWDGSGSPNWSDADNWTPSGAPATSGDALIWGPLSAGHRTSVNDISGLTTSLAFNANIPGNVSLSGSAITLSGNVSGAFTGTVTIGMDLSMASTGRTFGLTGAGSSLILDGVISSATSSALLTITNPGSSVYLNGLNTFTGVVRVSNGNAYINTLANSGVAQSLGAGSSVDFGFASPTSTVTGNVVYTGSTAASTNKTFRVGQNSATGTQSGGFFNNGSGEVTWTGTQATTGGTPGVVQTFTLGGSNPGNNTWASAIKNNTGGGTMAFTKSDAGQWILSGSNTYTGVTNVNAGTLLVNGNQSAATGAVTVASLAMLGGSGTLGGAMTINGILAPGSGGIGTLTGTNGVTWNASAGNDWLFQLGTSGTSLAAANASTNNDLLNITGEFAQGTGSTFTFDFLNSGSDGWYKLVDYTTTNFSTGTNNSFQAKAGSLPGGKTATFVVDPTTTALYVQIVPEPSTIALLGVGGIALAAGLRRRRRPA